MYKLTIEKILNGYILTSYEEREDIKDELPYITELREVIEDIDDNENETMKKLLYKTAEYFGFRYNKFSEDNLNINFNGRGSKLEE